VNEILENLNDLKYYIIQLGEQGTLSNSEEEDLESIIEKIICKVKELSKC
jgi:hypothetical protein